MVGVEFEGLEEGVDPAWDELRSFPGALFGSWGGDGGGEGREIFWTAEEGNGEVDLLFVSQGGFFLFGFFFGGESTCAIA